MSGRGGVAPLQKIPMGGGGAYNGTRAPQNYPSPSNSVSNIY